MVPHQGRAIDTVNFRNVKESNSSMDMGNGTGLGGGVSKDGMLGIPGSALKGVPRRQEGSWRIRLRNSTASRCITMMTMTGEEGDGDDDCIKVYGD